MERKALVIGSLVIDEFEGELSFGGDALNEAVILSKEGIKTSLSALVGHDYADKIKEELDRYGIIDCLSVSDIYQTTISHITLDENHDRHFSVEGGAHRHFLKEDLRHDLSDIKALSIASLFSMKDYQLDGMEETLRKAKEKGILTFADTSKDRNHLGLNGIRHLLPFIDYFMPGLDEIKDSLKLDDTDKIADMLKANGATHILFKMGEEGALYYGPETKVHYPSIKVDVIDTTGAGDTFCATLISSLLKEKSLDEAIKDAVKAGALRCTIKGAHA